MAEINWAIINSRLPYARTGEDREQRRKMWRAIDVNDNGFVSLAEITRVRHEILARAVGVPVGQCSGGQLAMI